MLLSVPQAAEELDLDAGRVRRLVASGALAGQKVGGRWLVDDASAAARLQSRRRSGRPLSQRSAWGLLWAADNRPMPWLAPREQSRAIERSRGWPVAVVDLLDARDDRSARAARGLADRMRKR